MEQAAATPLKKTPLHARHRASGARMVPFAGWEMPVEYSGIVSEHMAVRTRAGLFDVSHMGDAVGERGAGGGSDNGMSVTGRSHRRIADYPLDRPRPSPQRRSGR